MNTEVLKTTDPRDLGKRLQEARKAKGLTQQDTADHLGVARTTITAIEKGERRVQASELVRLATLYGRDVSEMLRQDGPFEDFAVQLRSALAFDRPLEAEIIPVALDFQRLCEDYLALERLCEAPLTRKYPPPYPIGGIGPEAAAEDVANAERNRLGLGDGPIHNLREVLENDVGLRIFYISMPSRISGMFAYNEELGGCIAVNRNHRPERRRMSLLHEYAHFLSNRQAPEVTVPGRYQRQPEHERFANAFAWAFMMPASGLSRRYNEMRRSRGGRVTPADLCTLAHLYCVSFEGLALRLEELRLLAQGTLERLKQKGFHVQEAQERLGLPRYPSDIAMLPARYQYLAAEAFERGRIKTEGRLAEYLRLDIVEARRLMEVLSDRDVVSEQGEVSHLILDLGVDLREQDA